MGATRAKTDITDEIAASAYAIIDLTSHATLVEQRAEWLDAPVWPGSIAKLATYTAAIEAGTLDADTRILCTRRVTLRDGRRVDCSHPPVTSALSLREAVAMSCNVFAAEVARRLSASQLASGFARLGLPVPPSAAAAAADADPVAIGLGLAGTQIPPRRLLEALARVIDATKPPLASVVQGALREGLRDSARSGTASAFGHAGLDAYAKTGTALMRNSRPLGLVVAVAPAPRPRYGIVVALPGGAGADAADVAAHVLANWLRASGPISASRDDAALAGAGAAAATSRPTAGNTLTPGRGGRASSGHAMTMIRVGTPQAHGYRVDQMPLEEYVARVVAGEASAEPGAVQEALAVVARTYALANRGRHKADGFDLCTLTHCQVLRPASMASREAAHATRGRVLVQKGQEAAGAVPVFYSASCGGVLEDASVLLPDAPRGSIGWMTSRPDPAGMAEPAWEKELSAADLLAALRGAGVRGDELRDLRAQADANGRVTTIVLGGLTPSTLPADDFRRIIGQRLGWQWLKSPRFTVIRTARGYRFFGHGHGHGVGLCVYGASSLAQRGQSRDDILRTYFPGLLPIVLNATTAIDVRLPASEERERANLRAQVERHLREIGTALGDDVTPARLSLIVHPTVDSYRRATGRPWWTSAATTFDDAAGTATIHLIPLDGLRRANRLDAVIRHEIVHVLTGPRLRNAPLWVQEGIAAHFAGERLPDAAASSSACPTDAEFKRAPSPDAFQQTYARATACVERELARGVPWTLIGPRSGGGAG